MMYSEKCYSSLELNLYNPAFCGLLLTVAIRDYQEKQNEGMHCLLPFILLPIALNNSIAKNLPHSTTTPIAGWVAENEGLLVGLPVSAGAFLDIVDTGLAFLVSRRVIQLSNDGKFCIADDKLPKRNTLQRYDQSLSHIIKSAAFLGRWFASASSVESIYAQFGVRP